MTAGVVGCLVLSCCLGTPPSATLGTPVAGTPVAGTPVAGTPVAGTPVAGTPVAGTPVAGTPVAGTPVAASSRSPTQEDRPHLFKMMVGPDRKIQLHGEVFTPQPGDLVLFDDGHRFFTFCYKLCGSGGPLHSAIVFNRPDGTPALLEAGPQMTPKVYVLEIEPRFKDYYGTIMVRRLKTPLPPEQSKQLTDFALAQEGKLYARVRLALQATPFKARGTLRTWCLGKTVLDRERWMCSEITAAAATAAGVLNKKRFFANGMYPRDFAYDEVYDLSPYYEEPVIWYPSGKLEFLDGAIKLQDNHKKAGFRLPGRHP